MIFCVANESLSLTVKAQDRSPCKASVLLTRMNEIENPREAAQSATQCEAQVKHELPPLTQDEIDRFWRKVDKTENPRECWRWNAGTRPTGYGVIRLRHSNWVAHRVAFQLSNAVSPGNFCVCHSCDNPLCCNPAHLWLGTKGDNNRDRETKGRGNQATGDRHGTRIHPESVRRGMFSGGRKNAIVSEDQAREIRMRYSSARGVCRDLAKEFGVSKSVVYCIGNGKTWRDLECHP